MLEEHSGPVDDVLRQQLYSGKLFRIAATDASRTLIGMLREELSSVFQGDPQQAHRRLPNDVWLARVSDVRKSIDSPSYHHAQRALLAAFGFDLRHTLFHPMRLRAVKPGGHRIPEAAAAYFVHRDTWYGCPKAQINVWIPLWDCPPEQSFVFYPQVFEQTLPNNSEAFDYDHFASKVGWQNSSAPPGTVYPTVLTSPSLGPPFTFAAGAGECLLFSAAHLHQTCAHEGPSTRFSIDLRTVWLPDQEASRGALDPDNHSQGSMLGDFLAGGARSD